MRGSTWAWKIALIETWRRREERRRAAQRYIKRWHREK